MFGEVPMKKKLLFITFTFIMRATWRDAGSIVQIDLEGKL